MVKYRLIVDVGALQDIQEISDWYNSHSEGLGARFQKQLRIQINKLKTTPHSYRLRYANMRCTLVKNFPFLIHFSINAEKAEVTVYAVIHTSRNPRIWEGDMQ